MYKNLPILAGILLVSFTAHAEPGNNGVVPKPAWADSYSANGKCYIDSNFDHGIGEEIVPTPIGGQSVRQVAARIGSGPGRAGNPVYNDVQCGNGPANNAGDEDYDQCPGRVDQGAAGCSVIGPKWDLKTVYANQQSSGTQFSKSSDLSTTSSPMCTANGSNLVSAKQAFAQQCKGLKRRDCDPAVLDNVKVWMCATFTIGRGAPAGLSTTTQNSKGAQAEVSTTTVLKVGRCDALGSNLAEARMAYAKACSAKRRDCDPTGRGNQYLCASYNIVGKPVVSINATAATPAQIAVPTQTAKPAAIPTQTATSEPVAINSCEATGANLRLARDAYAAQCSLPRKDCDPIASGYLCASYTIGSIPAGGVASGSFTSPQVTNTGSSNSNPTAGTIRLEAETMSGSGWVDRGGYIEFTGSNSYAAPTYGVLSYDVTIPAAGIWEMRWRAKAARKTAGRSDLHNDAWAQMNGSPAAGFHDVRAFRKVFTSGNGSWQIAATVDLGGHNFSKFRQRLSPGTYRFEISGRSIGYAIDYIEFFQVNGQSVNPPPTSTAGPLPALGGISSYLYSFNQPYEDGDLLSMHWDSSLDPDDMQAMILTREILNDHSPSVDFIAVNGTKRRVNDRILSGSTAHMRSMFPGGFEAWRNGLSNAAQSQLYSSTVNTLATAWALTLSSGHRVHVAEGGPSDFTASVINELRRRGVNEASLKNIRVIQHSWGWNEANTSDAALNTVRRYANYIRIANGNLGNGEGPGHTATPDYHFNNPSHSQCGPFRARALASQYGTQWQTAFNAIRNKCDGSDAVEVMWILGIPTGLAPTLARFADRYF